MVLAICGYRPRLEAVAWDSLVAAAFLSELKDRHDLSETEFLVDGYGYLTALARCNLRGDLEYADRNKIEKWFQTLKMRVERFHNTWLAVLVYYYNFQRPNQALNNRTPVEEVTNK